MAINMEETYLPPYGWRPDLPDHRDFMYGAIAQIPAVSALPASVDLRPLCSNIEDQGQLGSCTGNALVGVLEFLERKDKVLFADLSRLFVYYNERMIENTVSQDAGASIRDGIKTLATYGVCQENAATVRTNWEMFWEWLTATSKQTNWPYDISKFAVKPPASCYTAALAHKITLYGRLNTLLEMKACLASGFPFVYGFTVYDSFESQEVADTGIVPMPDKTESVLGGHAVAAVGYNDASQRFIVRNSWGANWGMKGYFTMPYDYLADRNLSDDFWTVRRGGGF
jgi:C1A family cysteine protease